MYGVPMLSTCSDKLDSRLRNWTWTQATNPKSGQGVEHCALQESKGQVGTQVLDLQRRHVRDKAQAWRLLRLSCACLPGPGIFPVHLLLLTLTRNLPTAPALTRSCSVWAIFSLCSCKDHSPEDTHLGSGRDK